MIIIRDIPMLIFSMGFLVAFGLLATIHSTEVVTSFDSQIIQAIQTIKHPYLTSLMKFFSYIGDRVRVVLISVLILGILYKIFRRRMELLLFTITLIGSSILNVLLKNLFQRERPTLYTMITAEGFSFPSGHTMGAFSLYGIIIFLLWGHIRKQSGRIILLVVSVTFILAIGISRIYLGVHFPSDVIGAYLFSGFWLLLCIWSFRNIQGNLARKVQHD